MRALIWCATNHCSVLDEVALVDPLLPMGLLLFAVFLAIGNRVTTFNHVE